MAKSKLKDVEIRTSNLTTKLLAFLVSLLAVTQTACIAVGYSSRGGWFMWPGGLGLLVILALIFLFLRR